MKAKRRVVTLTETETILFLNIKTAQGYRCPRCVAELMRLAPGDLIELIRKSLDKTEFHQEGEPDDSNEDL
jgi:hypothetical protein